MKIINPQPDGSAGRWARDKSLGTQVKFAIQDIETNRSFDEVNITLIITIILIYLLFILIFKSLK